MRSSTSKSFLWPARKSRNNLHIAIEAQVTKVLPKLMFVRFFSLFCFVCLFYLFIVVVFAVVSSPSFSFLNYFVLIKIRNSIAHWWKRSPHARSV